MRHFINLSNGVEALADLEPGASWAFIRLTSTALEQEDWLRIFGSEVSDDLLMWLAVGERCVLYDRGTHRKNSKTVYLGAPVIRHVLASVWGLATPAQVLGPGPRTDQEVCDRTTIAGRALAAVTAPSRAAGEVLRRLRYYRRFLHTTEIRLTGSSLATEHDGDVAHQNQCLTSALGVGSVRVCKK